MVNDTRMRANLSGVRLSETRLAVLVYQGTYRVKATISILGSSNTLARVLSPQTRPFLQTLAGNRQS
jgi:hypothetical protein